MLIIMVLSVLSFSPPLFAMELITTANVSPFRLVENCINLISTPISDPDKMAYLPALGTALLLFQIDDQIQSDLQNTIYPWLNSHYSVASSVGDKTIAEIPNLLFLTSGYALDKQMLKTSLAMSDALMTSLVFAQSLKQILARSRPVNGGSSNEWWHWQSDLYGQYTGFPSSHATIYSSAATVVGKMYQCEPLAYAGALLLFCGDMNAHHHWVSDMVMGAWLGHTIGDFWVDYYSDKTVSWDTWQIIPYVEVGGAFSPMVMIRKMI